MEGGEEGGKEAAALNLDTFVLQIKKKLIGISAISNI